MAGGRTIVAVSSPPGPGARAVLRLSGDAAGPLVAARLGRAVPERRALVVGRFDDGAGTQPCLWLWMPGPHSYTREDVSELHLPGAVPLVDAALGALLAGGAELAAPGEFTRRAFEHGRLDLTEAEGVLGLIEAADLAAVRSAAQLLSGGLGRRVTELRDGLDGLRALAEASLDFDSDETGHVAAAELTARATELEAKLHAALAFEEQRQSARARPRVVLAGRPNAGKSSLFNTLTAAEGHAAALVSDLAGSTRDGKRAEWIVRGVAVELYDAPGFEVEVEREDEAEHALAGAASARAQRLAEATRRGADVVLWALPADELRADPDALAADRARIPAGAQVLPVVTKADLLADVAGGTGRGGSALGGAGDPLAALTNRSTADLLDPGATLWTADAGACSGQGAAAHDGLAALEDAVADALGLVHPSARVAEAASLGRELSARHRAALRRGLEVLEEARGALAAGIPLDLVAETLREATAELDAITGRTTPEDLLDRIFAGFCLGK